MAEGNSLQVESSQLGPHTDLEWSVRRHLQHPFRRPVAEHTRNAFLLAQQWVESLGLPLILDTGCGVGESTHRLAREFPHCAVLGIDKSELRLSRSALHASLSAESPRVFFVRADLVDFWLLASQAGWVLERHCLFYPNPWPKPGHLSRRWHGHPIFPILLSLGGVLELRTNWRIYAEEFAQAFSWATGRLGVLQPLEMGEAWTPFERKYAASGHDLWQFLG